MRVSAIPKNNFLENWPQSWLITLQQMVLCKVYLAITFILIDIFVKLF